MNIFSTTKSKAQLAAESAAAMSQYISNGGTIQRDTKEADTTISAEEGGRLNFKEDHFMDYPMLSEGRVRPGTLIVLILSKIGKVNVDFLNNRLLDGSSIGVSSIKNLGRYKGLLHLEGRGRNQTVELSPSGYRWLESHAEEIVCNVSRKNFIPDNYKNSPWVKQKATPALEALVTKFKEERKVWLEAKQRNPALTWADYRVKVAPKDYQVKAPTLGVGEIMTFTTLESAQAVQKGLVMQGFEATIIEIVRA